LIFIPSMITVLLHSFPFFSSFPSSFLYIGPLYLLICIWPYLTCAAQNISLRYLLRTGPSHVFRDNTLTSIFRHARITHSKCLLLYHFCPSLCSYLSARLPLEEF
jgi:hypothetical protein